MATPFGPLRPSKVRRGRMEGRYQAQKHPYWSNDETFHYFLLEDLRPEKMDSLFHQLTFNLFRRKK